MPERTVSILGVFVDRISGPAGTANRVLGAVGGTVEKVRARIAPLTGAVAGLAAGFGGLALAQRALAEAEREANAVARLTFALDRSLETRKRILDVAKELQETSVFGDEEATEVAARFAAIGVSAERIPRLLRLSADTASALGIGLAEAATEIGKIAQGGEARRLAQLVPDLKAIDDAAGGVEARLRLLEGRFSGFAEAVTETDFGKAAQGANRVSDVLERIGFAIVKIKVSFLAGLESALDRIARIAESPRGRAIVEIVAEVARWLPEIALGIAAVVGAAAGTRVLSTLLGILGAIAAGAASVVAALGSIGAAGAATIAVVASIGTALAVGTGAAKGIAEDFREAKKAAGEWLGEIDAAVRLLGEGRIELAAFFQFVGLKIAEVWTVFEGRFLTPLGIAARAIKDLFLGAFELLGVSVTFAVLKSVDFLVTKTLDAVRFFARALESALGDVLPALKGLADRIPKDSGLADLADKAGKRLGEVAATLRDTIPNAIDEMTVAYGRSIREQERLTARAEKTLTDSAARVLSKRIAAADAEVLAERSKIAAISRDRDRLLGDADRRARVSDALADPAKIVGIAAKEAVEIARLASREAQGPVRDILSRELERQVREGELAVGEFLAVRRELEVGLARDRVQEADAGIAAERERLRLLDAQAKTLEERSARSADALAFARSWGVESEFLLSLVQDQTRLDSARTDVQKQQKDAAQAILKLEEDRAEAIVEAAGGEEKLAEIRRGLARESLGRARADAEAARSALASALDAAAAGSTAPTEAVRAAGVALDEFDAALERARIATLDLLVGQPGDPKLLADLREIERELDDLERTRVEIDVDVSTAFGARVDAFVRRFEAQMADAGKRLARGDVLPSEAFEATSTAAADLAREIEAVSAALDFLATRSPEAAREVDKVRDAIERARLGLRNRDDLSRGEDPSSFFGGIVQGARLSTGELGNFERAGVALGRSLTDHLSSAIVEVWETGRISMRRFFSEFFSLIAKAIVQALVFRAISAGIGALFPAAPQNPGGGLAPGVQGPPAPPGLAEGGPVPGPRIRGDRVAARLEAGEYVVRRDAVDHYSLGVLEAINRRLLPRSALLARGVPAVAGVPGRTRFATGGEVAGGSEARAPLAGVLVGDDQTLDRMLAGGRSAFLRFLSRDAAAINAALGRGGAT